MDKSKQQLNGLIQRYPALQLCEPDIARVFELLVNRFQAGGRLLVCGNGGSAADAEHIAGELLKGFISKRPLTAADRERLGEETAQKLQRALPVIPLTGFLSLRTAYSNDCDPVWDYAQLTYALGRSGDMLLAISTSGNAHNVLAAADVARKTGLSVIGLTGCSGGELAAVADICIRVPEQETYKVQELHLPVYHTLCMMLEDHFFGEGTAV